MIVALRALGVGDLATAVPALRALRAAYPDRELVLAAPAWLAPLVELVGGVDRVLPTAGLERLAWPGAAVEVAVNLHGRGPDSHRLLAAVGPARLLAFANAEAGHLDGPAWDDDEHEVARWCRLLAAYGIAADPTDLDLRRPATTSLPAGVTVLHPGSKVPAKCWPPGRYAALARTLTERGHRVVLTGSARERDTVARVAAEAGLPPEAVFAGRTDVAGLAALVAGARLVVSGDTGVAHLATGYRTASVVLFGPVPPSRWGPPPERRRHRVLWAGGGAWPDWDGVGSHPTMAALDLDQVLAAVDEVERAVRADRAVAA
ncbi:MULTISPECIES: glycosyltransferase family 9 protein [Micromonospora]|uniref:Glycosyl transferase n=1 Tax=Micromonospora maris TaxID=1003110 RepID=A0A9X0I977_9ACTN|nr:MULTISPECIES: glycosyltransferase family 9 protein [Micromonospora]AEB43984.1 glycosyl transferase family 9 [Micromonospora maris AB-18-032]KUJ49222.1 glycosyl transferase [Micromonospora maris]RUL91337.1 glycosyltransferase family 9 protein [Verrucosispora sp. FIM060022]WSK44932.1 glycosyltransferase family 9 protein [Micromonospora maris]